MIDYVAYHSTEIMKRPFSPTENFSFLSGKAETILQGALGHRVWTIVGERMFRRQTYRLAGMFIPTAVQPAEGSEVRSADGRLFRITGPGIPLHPQSELTGLLWFRDLLAEQSQFRFGFGRIRSQTAINELEKLLQKRAPQHVLERLVVGSGGSQLPHKR